MSATHIDLLGKRRLQYKEPHPDRINHVFIDLDSGNDTRVVCTLFMVRPYADRIDLENARAA